MASEITNRISKDRLMLLVILAVAAILRFFHLGGFSLSNDELSALVRTEFGSLRELIDQGIRIDAHPAGVQVFLYYWIKIWGNSEAALRFPFALAGTLSVLLVYLIGKRWFGKLNGLLAAAALAALQFPLLYSQIARPYAPGLLFTLSAAWFWTLLLFSRDETQDTVSVAPTKHGRLWYAVGFSLSLAACAYTHYFSMLMAGLLVLSGLFFLNKNNCRDYIFACLASALLFLPHLRIFLQQLSYGGVGEWLGPPKPGFLGHFFDYGLNDSPWIKILWLAMCLVPMLAFPSRLKKPAFYILCIGLYLVPYFIGAWYSVAVNPVLQYSTLLFSYPFLLLFLSGFIPDEKVTGIVRILLVLFLLAAGTASTVVEKKYYSTNHFGVFKELASNAVLWNNRYGKDNVTTVLNVTNPAYVGYYFKRLGKYPTLAQSYVADESSLAKLRDLVDSARGDYFIYGWSNMPHPAEAVELVRQKYPVAMSQDTFFNASISLFKKGSDKNLVRFHEETSYEVNRWGDEEKKRTSEVAHTGLYSENMEGQEYGITRSWKLGDLQLQGNEVFSFSAWFRTTEDATQSQLVLSFEDAGNNIQWSSSPVKAWNRHPGTWQKIIITKFIPDDMPRTGEVKCYFLNPDKKKILVDDLSFTVRDPSYYR